jgi:hypothetical protein
MDLVTALFLDARRRWVRQVVNKTLSASSGSSFRATGISNAGGSRASISVKPTDFNRTCVACRPEGARQNQGKRAPTKFSDAGRGMGSHLRKRVNPFPALWSHLFWDQEWCLVLRAVPTAPTTPVHRSKASGGWDWVSPRGPQASLGSFRRSARTLTLAMSDEGGLSSTHHRVPTSV